jgi:hypothetical protein
MGFFLLLFQLISDVISRQRSSRNNSIKCIFSSAIDKCKNLSVNVFNKDSLLSRNNLTR